MKKKITLRFIILITTMYLVGSFIKDNFYWVQELAQTEQGRMDIAFGLIISLPISYLSYLISNMTDSMFLKSEETDTQEENYLFGFNCPNCGSRGEYTNKLTYEPVSNSDKLKEDCTEIINMKNQIYGKDYFCDDKRK